VNQLEKLHSKLDKIGEEYGWHRFMPVHYFESDVFKKIYFEMAEQDPELIMISKNLMRATRESYVE
jgi:hypothetical protein